MARKRKNTTDIDLDALADKIAERLSSTSFTSRPYQSHLLEEDWSPTPITISDRIIPMKTVDIEAEDTHVSESIKEEKSVDADLKKSKTKLASILKNKGK